MESPDPLLMLQWLKQWLRIPDRPRMRPEPEEPPQTVNAPGFQVSFAAGGLPPLRPAGRRFHARLFLWTPLWVLKMHGQFIPGKEGGTESSIPAEFGAWVGEPAAPAGWVAPELDVESDAGRVKPSQALPFFEAFRAIVEGEADPTDQARQLNRLHLLRPAWRPYVEALRRPSEIHPDGAPDLASVWFCPHLLAELPGLAPALAAVLYGAGILTAGQVRRATEEDLRKVPGLPRSALKRLRKS